MNSGVKQLAFSEVLPPSEMDRLYTEALRVAARNHVQLYRESSLLGAGAAREQGEQPGLFIVWVCRGVEYAGRGTEFQEPLSQPRRATVCSKGRTEPLL